MSKIHKATQGSTHKATKAHHGHTTHKASSAPAEAPAAKKGWGPSSTGSAGKKHHLLRDAAMVAGIGMLLKHTVLNGNNLSVNGGGMTQNAFANALKQALGGTPNLTNGAFNLASPGKGIAGHVVDMFKGVYHAVKRAMGSDSILDETSLPEKPQFPGANASDQDLLKYQEAMQKYNRMLTMITQLLEMQHEGKKGVVQNLRA